MPLTRPQKEKIVKETADMLRGKHMVIFADFRGMGVMQSQAFRRRVKGMGGSFKVVKKTLARAALRKAGLPHDALTNYKDTLALSTHDTEDSALAKLFAQSAKEFPTLKMAGGIFGGKSILREELLELAKLPSKDELRAKLLGTLLAPISAFARVLAGSIQGFTTIINKLATK